MSSSMGSYVRFIAHPVIASLIFLAWIVFLAFSTIDIFRFEVNLSTKKMFAEDSPLLEVDSYQEGHIVPFFHMATVFINSPTNLSDPVRVACLNELVRDMEAIPGSWGPKSTNYFVRELDKFVGEEGELGPDQMEQFLDWPEKCLWKSQRIVHGFYFTTGYHGKRLRVLTDHKNDVTDYTPYGARSRQELATQEHFFNAQGLGHPFGLFVLLRPLRADDNFLRPPMLAEASSILGRKFNIQPNFLGIQFRSTSSTSTSNATTDTDSSQQQQLISNMKRVDMVVLTYKAERIGAWTDDEIKEWKMGVSHYFEQEFKSPYVHVMTFSTTYVEVEVVRAGLSMLPFLMVGFAIMATCTSVSMLLSAIYLRQWHVQKLALALMACVCPFMACGTALGLLFLAGVRFGSVLCVTPFLVLAIGVDDGYLMMHTWQRLTDQTRRKRKTTTTMATNGADDETELLTQRPTMVLVETRPTVLISALTNICADAIGSFTGSLEITLLCVGNMAAMALDFLYQITFYAAAMAMYSASMFPLSIFIAFQHALRVTKHKIVQRGRSNTRIRSICWHFTFAVILTAGFGTDAASTMSPDVMEKELQRTADNVSFAFQSKILYMAVLLTGVAISVWMILICVEVVRVRKQTKKDMGKIKRLLLRQTRLVDLGADDGINIDVDDQNVRYALA